MKEGSVCFTEDVLCIFYDSRKEGWFLKQPKKVYLQCGWSRSEWVGLPPPPLWNFPSRPLRSPFPLSYPSPQTPTASALGNGKSWPFVHCSGLYCISLHCIVSHVAVQCSLNIFQCISQETSPPGHLCSFSLFSALRHFCKETVHDLCRSYIGPSLIPKHWTHGSWMRSATRCIFWWQWVWSWLTWVEPGPDGSH